MLSAKLIKIKEYKNGIYQGEFNNNVRDGLGIFYWFDGSIYIGNWKKDFIQGEGTLYFAYNGNYVGNFDENKPNGFGIITFSNGVTFACQWSKGKPQGLITKFDSKKGLWSIIQYQVGRKFQNIECENQEDNALKLYHQVKKEISTPYYKSQLLENPINLEDITKYRIKMVKLDDKLFYHGIVRGSRPDGLGIIFNEEGCYSIRGKFVNTKLSGIGRVELENGEIFDGQFRNGVFMKGTYFNSFGDYFVSGIFQNQVQYFCKGKGYPYEEILNNKQGNYPILREYKIHTVVTFYLPVEETNLIKNFNIQNYTNGKMKSESMLELSQFITPQKGISFFDENDSLPFKEIQNQSQIENQNSVYSINESNKNLNYLFQQQNNQNEQLYSDQNDHTLVSIIYQEPNQNSSRKNFSQNKNYENQFEDLQSKFLSLSQEIALKQFSTNNSQLKNQDNSSFNSISQSSNSKYSSKNSSQNQTQNKQIKINKIYDNSDINQIEYINNKKGITFQFKDEQ